MPKQTSSVGLYVAFDGMMQLDAFIVPGARTLLFAPMDFLGKFGFTLMNNLLKMYALAGMRMNITAAFLKNNGDPRADLSHFGII